MSTPESHFLLGSEEAKSLAWLLSAEAHRPGTPEFRQLIDFDMRIRWLIQEEMAAVHGSANIGTAFAVGGDPARDKHLAPERRAWINLTSLEQKVAGDGISGFLFDREHELPGVLEGLKLFGFHTLADEIQNFASIPEHARMDPDESAIDHSIGKVDWAIKRLELALSVPRMFFRES